MTTCNLAVNGPVKPIPENYGAGPSGGAGYGGGYGAVPATGHYPLVATQPHPTGGAYGASMNGGGAYRAPYPAQSGGTSGASMGGYGAPPTSYPGYGYGA